MSERTIIRCPKCKLNQFLLDSGKCRRCFEVLVAKALKQEDIHITPSESFHMALGMRLKMTRKALGMSQKFTLSRSHLSRIENGWADLSPNVMEKFCESAGISIREFLSGAWIHKIDEFSLGLLEARRTLSQEDFSKIMGIISTL